MADMPDHQSILLDALTEPGHELDAHTAASVGDLEHLERLDVETPGGLDTNARNASGWTPLLYAAHYDHPAVLRFLAARGADPAAASGGGGRRALALAAACGNEASLRELLRRFGGAAAAVLSDGTAAASGCAELLEARDSRGMTALAHAAVCGHAGAARILLEAGARTDVAENTAGYTPLMLACREGHEVAAQWLVHHGADANHANILGETPRTVAARMGHDRISRFLAGTARSAVPATSAPMHSILDGPARLAEKLAKQQHQRQQQQQKQQMQLAQDQQPGPVAKDLPGFLSRAGVEKYEETLKDHGVTELQHLLRMGDEELKSAGITLLGPRRKLTSAIARHRNQTTKAQIQKDEEGAGAGS